MQSAFAFEKLTTYALFPCPLLRQEFHLMGQLSLKTHKRRSQNDRCTCLSISLWVDCRDYLNIW